MGIFSKKQKLVTCLICRESIPGGITGDSMSHYESHVRQIPPGNGDASGQYTWSCVCGPAGLKWTEDYKAAAGLAFHMHSRHGMPL